jgi:lipopolysaccharide transport protein LptA
MAASYRNRLAAVLLAAACLGAAAQERDQSPIQVQSQGGTDYDYQNGVLKFSGITITQGAVKITAEHAVASGLDFKDSSWEFSGSVRITMPDSSLASDTARVRFANGEVASALVTGAPANFVQQRKQERAEGHANRIDYDLKRGTVEFAGDAWLKDARTELTGDTLVYSTANERVISEKPVVITIQPGAPAPDKQKPKP